MDEAVNIKDYHIMAKKLRGYFDSLGFVEVYTQGRRSILAACEDPTTIATYEIEGVKWPLPQTGQMWLEYDLLTNPGLPGVYCFTTSYRAEKKPIHGRHDIIFPMFEIESKGTITDLENLGRNLLRHLGFPEGISISYEDTCEKYGVSILEAEHEAMLNRDYGRVVLLHSFPERTSPFWNMRRNGDGTSSKIDFIIHDNETIGSAERSCNPDEMRERFHTISDGEYSQKLFDEFGRERVEAELEKFLSHNFFPRFGWGMGLLPRFRNAMKKEGLLESLN